MKAIVVTDQAAGTAGMTLVERPEPQAAKRSTSGQSRPLLKERLCGFLVDTSSFAVSTSKFTCDGREVMGISTMAPIFEVIEGARAGETVEFNGEGSL